MLNSIIGKKIKREDGYNLYLEMPKNEYFGAYEDVTEENARNILELFLQHYQDDGRLESVNINYNRGRDIVGINAFLSYEENDHTKARHIPDYLI